MRDETGDNGTKNVEIMVPLKYLSDFWRALEINWSKNCVIVATHVAFQATTSPITDKKRKIPVVTLSTQDNAKMFEKLKSI